jgi:ADP-heptose:LPS heptosyltransferase
MSLKGKVIVLRFSAMGDVAMVATVLKEFIIQNPEVELIMVSRVAFEPFFKDLKNVNFHAIQPHTTHKNIIGLFKLYRKLKKYNPIAIADLHDNLRSRILSTFFRFSGIIIKRIDKGRIEKRALTRTKNKIFKPLKQTVERYADVFRDLGFTLTLSQRLTKSPKDLPISAKNWFNDGNKKKIGISPFAQHIYKVYPKIKMQEVIRQLATENCQLFIFGGGKQEKVIAEAWEKEFENVYSLIGNYNLTEELAIISNLDLMLSMDSSGMHLASLMGVPVVSIWGPTHPYAGFLGYGQSESDCIQIDHPNRPNSIYGNKLCLDGVNNCINLIKPEVVVQKIKEKLGL